MFNFRLLLSPGFWFTTQWNPVTMKTIWFMTIVFLLLIAAGVAVLVVASRTRDDLPARHLQRISGPLFFGGLVGLFFTFVLQQQIPILSARFWFLLLGIIVAAWLTVTIRALLVRVPKMKATARARDEFAQYLPKRKKR